MKCRNTKQAKAKQTFENDMKETELENWRVEIYRLWQGRANLVIEDGRSFLFWEKKYGEGRGRKGKSAPAEK